MNKTLVAVTASLAFMAGTAHAQPYGGGYPGAMGYPGALGYPGSGYPGGQAYPAEAGVEEALSPAVILRQGIDRLKGFLARGAADPADVQAFLDQEIAPYFDFAYMSQWAGGPLYRQMDEAQKAEFAANLKQLFFAALARNLGTFSTTAPRIDIFPARVRPYSREVTVNARVMRDRGQVVNLQFRFYRGDEGWKVFDVTANGTSAVAYYRRYFNAMARQGMR